MLYRGRRSKYSDRELEFVECGRQPEHRLDLNSQLVVSAAEVLDERMSSDHDARRSVGLQSTHRPQPGLQSAVVAFTSIVLVLPSVVERRRDQLVDHARKGRSTIGDDLRGGAMRPKRGGEEPPCGGDISVLGDEHVNDLAVLVDGPVDVPPHSGDLDVGFVDEPPVADGTPARTGSVDQLRGESLDPPVQGDMVHLDAALGEELLKIPVGQAVPQVPADRQQDDVRRETEPYER